MRLQQLSSVRAQGLEPDALRQLLAVVGRVAEEELRGLRPLEVEVRWVFPGETNATVDLDVLCSCVEVGLLSLIHI